MDLEQYQLPTADDFIALKARVKKEILRRNKTGNISNTYGTSAYDYSNPPKKNELVLTEHYNKIITPLNAIKNTNLPNDGKNIIIKALTGVEAALTVHEAAPQIGNSSTCGAACAGMCAGCTGTCVGSCSSCTGTCSGTCSGGCSGGCSSCSGTCSGTCSGGCSGGCKGSCRGGCSGNCKSYACGLGCAETCSGSCNDTIMPG